MTTPSSPAPGDDSTAGTGAGAPAGLDPALVGLARCVHETEAHVAASGWDGPVRVFALVGTARALATDPSLAQVLPVGPEQATDPFHLVAIEQDGLPDADSLESLLAQLGWPESVDGAALVVERLVVPPDAESELRPGSARTRRPSVSRRIPGPRTCGSRRECCAPASPGARSARAVTTTTSRWPAARTRCLVSSRPCAPPSADHPPPTGRFAPAERTVHSHRTDGSLSSNGRFAPSRASIPSARWYGTGRSAMRKRPVGGAEAAARRYGTGRSAVWKRPLGGMEASARRRWVSCRLAGRWTRPGRSPRPRTTRPRGW